MYGRARRALLAGALTFVANVAAAQAVWEPTPPPRVTAENEPWYRAASPIEWNGNVYYPAGVPRAFDPNVMVRAGSYRGIPLYSDTTLEPFSIVFVPIAGGRLQPYEHLRTGMFADTAGSLTPSFPLETSAAHDLRRGGSAAQAPAPPMSAQPESVSPNEVVSPYQQPPPITAAPSSTPVAPAPVGTSGRTISPSPPVSTAIPPTGINNAWIDYDGHRWIVEGKATPRTPDMQPIGTFRGFTIYIRGGDRLTIYVPSTAELVVPFKRR